MKITCQYFPKSIWSGLSNEPKANLVLYRKGETRRTGTRKQRIIFRADIGLSLNFYVSHLTSNRYFLIVLYLMKYWTGKEAIGNMKATVCNPSMYDWNWNPKWEAAPLIPNITIPEASWNFWENKIICSNHMKNLPFDKRNRELLRTSPRLRQSEAF